MACRTTLVFLIALFAACVPARAFTLSSTVEALTISSVNATFQTVNFENTYTSPVPVCTYQLPSTSDPNVVVRIDTLGSSSMRVRIQQPRDSSTVTAGTVFCLVAELGVTLLPDGRRIEARTVDVSNTHGRNVPLGFNNASVSGMNNISGSFSGFTNAIALGQIISYNDTDFTNFHANDCENRGNPAFLSGFSDGICVTKHVGEDNTTRATETLGVIVIERGSGSYDGIAYDAVRGGDSIRGVGNGGNNYSLSGTFEFAVATVAGEDGGDGGRVVFLGASSVGGSTLTLAIDEDTLNDTERSHTTENVDYFVVRRLPLFTAAKAVDRSSVAELLTLNYDITLVNTGELDQTGVSVTDTLPDGSSGTVTGPTESLTTDGIFEVGETWTYTISYTVTGADLSAGTDLINNIAVTTTEYTSESLADETASATTTIEPGNPSLNVTKSADDTTDVVAGQTITYTYVVENTGNQSISNLSLSDIHNGSGPAPSPANESLTLDANVAGDSSDSTANDGIWDVLYPGDQITFTGTYVVTQNDVDTLQ